MRQTGRKYLIYEDAVKPSGGNYVDENFLLVNYPDVKPYSDISSKVVEYVASSAPSLSKQTTPLTNFLKNGRTVQACSEFINWKLFADSRHTATLVRNLCEGVDFPGVGGTEFQIALDVDWYREGDVLFPDVLKRCQVIIQGNHGPIPAGSYFVYTVVLASEDPEAFFPPELLEPGLKWCKLGSFYGEESHDYGSLQPDQGMSFLEFQTNTSHYGVEFKITDRAHMLNLKVEAVDKSGHKDKSVPAQIFPYMQAKMMATYKYEKELILTYGAGTGRTVSDTSSNRHRRFGPGLYEYLEDGNVFEYSPENDDVNVIEDWLQQIFFDRVAYDKRNITIYTGEKGFKWWVDSLTEKYGSLNTGDSNFYVKTTNKKTFPGQNQMELEAPTSFFSQHNMWPTGKIVIEHWPILDSRELNGDLLYNGFPASSWEMIILDYGLGNGIDSNIVQVECPDSKIYTVICGTWSPAGAINGLKGKAGYNSSHKGRYYEVVMAEDFGIVVKDVSRTAMFRPNFCY